MSDELRKKMDTWFYYLIKGAARMSYADFIADDCNMSEDEYDEMSEFIKERLGVELSL